jgi:PAS domain S-box-containing protein
VPELGTDKWCVSWKLYHPDGTPMPHDQCPMAVALKEGRAVRGAEAIAERPDGSRIWFTPYPTPLFGPDGEVASGINMLVDITDRKRKEDAVRRSELRLRRMINVDVVGVLLFDHSGTAIGCNDAFLSMTGYSREEIESRRVHWRDMTPPEHVEASERQMEQFARTLRIGPYEKEYFRKDGSRFWMMFAGADLGDGTIVEYCIDISERKAAEEKLRELNASLERLVSERTAQLEQSHRRLRISERMASLGTLAAGLGHDMGNLLLPIRVRLETLETRGVLEEGRQDVAAIRDSLGYLQKLVSGLRLLAIDTAPGANKDTTELRSWWSETAGVLRNVLPRGIELKGAPPETECRVAIPAAALTQAVFNLVQNAGEAMRPAGKGTVTVSAERDADYVRLVIADTGPGMSEEVQRRCMEPFFTTKTRDVSTGLGLALVYGLVRQAGGAIDLESAPGIGTTFTLYLKCAAIDRPGNADPPRRAVVNVKDARTRAVLQHELRILSYDVRTDAGAPHEADLVVTDDSRFDGAVRGRLVVLAESSAARGQVVVIGPRPRIDALRRAIRDDGPPAPGTDTPRHAPIATAEQTAR